MIDKALNIIKQELNGYAELIGNTVSNTDIVVLENISQLDAANSTIDWSNKVIMTLVNMSEETSLKNMSAIRKNGAVFSLQNPPIQMNLFVLFVANSTQYETSLIRIGAIVKFFQGRRIFQGKAYPDPSNTPDPTGIMTVPGPNPNSPRLLIEYKLIVDLHSPTLEELNNLWGMLGGKQLPSVLYRIRMVELDSQQVIEADVPLVQREPIVQTFQVNPVPPL